MKCLVCAQRKGKRHCPAKNALICAQCCGEKRVVEIDCPSGCAFLTSGQVYQTDKKLTQQFSRENYGDREMRYHDTLYRYMPVIHDLESFLVEYARDLRTLEDRDVLQAVDTVAKNFRTEMKGILYAHSSSNPLADTLAQALHEHLESLRDAIREESDVPFEISDVIDCLDVMRCDLEFHLSDRNDGLSYLEFISRNHHRKEGDSDEGRIVLAD